MIIKLQIYIFFLKILSTKNIRIKIDDFISKEVIAEEVVDEEKEEVPVEREEVDVLDTDEDEKEVEDDDREEGEFEEIDSVGSIDYGDGDGDGKYFTADMNLEKVLKILDDELTDAQVRLYTILIKTYADMIKRSVNESVLISRINYFCNYKIVI